MKDDEQLALVERWATINSGSENLEGLAAMRVALLEEFAVLESDAEEVELPTRTVVNLEGIPVQKASGKALVLKKHPQALIQVFLGGHYDTVYQLDSEFQKSTRLGERLKGPGVADMKGGLAILLRALESLETSEHAGKVGWEAVLNPDEEIGSSASQRLIRKHAKGKQFGLIFEPAFADGKLVSTRKGSINYTIVVRGKSAHAGRDFYQGRSAIGALAAFIVKADRFNKKDGTILNFGHIQGGVAPNIVPDLAICKMNVRVPDAAHMSMIRKDLEEIAKEASEGISISLFENSARSPKPFDKKSEILFDAFRTCGKELGIQLDWKPSGGVCDGNILAEEGIPTVDTLGAVGGHIHTPDEYILISSLAERTALTALFLEKLAMGKI